jgi:predicted ArsR family transcriptional regulator
MASKQYPFVTRKQIQQRLATEREFVVECAVILESRTRGRTAGLAPAGKSWGWMSSERAVAGRLVELARTYSISTTDMTKLRRMVARYSRQLADDLRTAQLRDHPELIEVARLFSVATDAGTPAETTAEAESDDEAQDSEQEFAQAIISALQKSPGLRAEELADRLGVLTAYLSPTLRSLVDSGALQRQGAARGTRYSVR